MKLLKLVDLCLVDRRFWLFLVIFLLMGSGMLLCPACAGQLPEEALAVLLKSQGRVRIGIGALRGPIKVSSESGFLLNDSHMGSQESVESHEISVSQSGNSIVANLPGKTFRASQELVITSRANTYLKLRGRVYAGSIVVTMARHGVEIVNELPLEQYLVGVVAAEIGDAPLEALKAQAVVARSEVIHKLSSGRHQGDGFDLCASEHCMAYKGMNEVSPAMLEAVEATRGIVLVAGGKVLDAVFHNVCGGITAGAEDVWDSKPIIGLQPIWDVPQSSELPGFRQEEELRKFLHMPPASCFCNPENGKFPTYAQKYFRWKREFGHAELKKRFGADVLNVKIIERRASGRVRKVLIETTRGSQIVEKELPIRRLFDLPSGLFVLDVVRLGGRIEKVVFYGGGSGHGVGLCQMGAWSMAQKGYSYEDILTHYYPRARLMQLYR